MIPYPISSISNNIIAPVNSNKFTSDVPRATDGELIKSLVIPKDFAFFITFSLPTLSDIFTATVLIDFAKASDIEISPKNSFCNFQVTSPNRNFRISCNIIWRKTVF